MAFIIGLLVFIIIVSIVVLARKDKQHKKMLSDIAHDVRNPLSIIKTNNELALLNPNTPPEIKEILQSNIEELNRASHIIHKLVR